MNDPRNSSHSRQDYRQGSSYAGLPTMSTFQRVTSDDSVMYLQGEWQKNPEFTVMLGNLPNKVTTENIWDWFSNEGDIAYIDIWENRRLMYAKVRFEPPPRRAFWAKGSYEVHHPDQHGNYKTLQIEVTPSRGNTPSGRIRSPICPDRQFPVKITVYPLSFQIGSQVKPTSMKSMKSFLPMGEDKPLIMDVNLKFRRLTLFFPVEVKNHNGRYLRDHKLQIEFSQMKKVYRTSPGEGTSALIIPLQIPPCYYWRRDNIRETFSPEVNNWNALEGWNRATDVMANADQSLVYPVSLHTDLHDPTFVDIGRWTCFQITLKQDTDESRAQIDLLQQALHDFNIHFESDSEFEVNPGQTADMWDRLDHPTVKEEKGALGLLELSPHPMIQLPFEVRYQLEVCISRGILNEHNVTAELLQWLANMDPIKARLRLEYLADRAETVWEPVTLFTNPEAEAYFPNPRIPHYCAMVRKAVVTPTTIRFNTPTVETSNRVMRRYSHIQDRFLRVQFVGESEKGRITINKDQNHEIWKRVLRTLYQGIRIGDRVYEFLAFGSSQLRQCGAYFFCPTDHISCDDIRKWMGRFSHIKIVGKYAARLGQCFSTTREIRGIYVPEIRPIPDVERNDYCFTDGVGIISDLVSKLVIEEMDLDVFDRPSAFQFRMGGCKGVLTVWPHAKGTEVHVRESQEKFKADYNGLEIIRCARFATAALNRQTITILESLGVDKLVFLNLLDQQLRSYEQSMEDNRTAIELLTKFVDENQTTLIIAELLKAGFKTDAIHEPFVVNILSLWQSWSLKLLKEKARVQVEKSAFLLGCVDESGTLRGHSVETEGSTDKDVNKLPQIFLQITDSKEYNKTHIVKGVCIVGRNPSLHPGDIRVVQAVDNPKLHHLKDVVVFPKTGDRPVPNMLSGGDLDGDDFFVMWDPDLMPQTWNYPPMDYTGSKPLKLDRDVNVNDLRDFFVKYMKNDVLPLIATSHLAYADDLGPMSPKCLKLAELHSNAVDYPKTGQPAPWTREHQAKKWPHFMEKKNSYHSTRALGLIYDRVATKAIQFKPIWDSPFDQRIIKRFKLDHAILKKARQVKSQYDMAVRRLLSQHDLTTEFELWTGFAMTKPPIVTDYKQQEDLGREYDALKRRFRELCYEAAGGKTPELIDPFVAAMYTVTQEEIQIALFEQKKRDAVYGETGGARPPNPRSMPLISFPWIFYWVMIRIAMGGSYNPKDSILAAARRRANGLQLGVHAKRNELRQEEMGDDGEKAKKSEDGLPGEDIQTYLPDGTVVHRGQPLTLFHPEEDDGYVTATEDSDEGKAAFYDAQEVVRDDCGSGGGADRAQQPGGPVDDDNDGGDDEGGGDGGAAGDSGDYEDEPEENAMDRLASLVGEE